MTKEKRREREGEREEWKRHYPMRIPGRGWGMKIWNCDKYRVQLNKWHLFWRSLPLPPSLSLPRLHLLDQFCAIVFQGRPDNVTLAHSPFLYFLVSPTHDTRATPTSLYLSLPFSLLLFLHNFPFNLIRSRIAVLGRNHVFLPSCGVVFVFLCVR